MILPIISFGSPILRKKCTTINEDYPDLKKLISNMWETMYNAKGVGLAAPQINKNISLFIVDTTPFHDEDEQIKPLKQVFINAKIIKEEGEEWSFNEGCLSIPEIREDINRNSIIKIEYLDDKFQKYIKKYDGIIARVIQHEYDHINGILFTDKINVIGSESREPNFVGS